MVDSNTTAIEAISERLSEVTALAEQLDRALTAAHLDPAAPPPPPSVEDVTDAPGDAGSDAPGSEQGEDQQHGDQQQGADHTDAIDSQAEHTDATTTEVSEQYNSQHHKNC